MKKLTSLLLVLFVTSFAANAQWKKVKGTGKVIDEKRSVENFETVAVSGHFKVVLQEGNEGSLVVSAQENLMEYIVTEVKDGKLKIGTRKGYSIRSSENIEVTVNYRDIRGASMSGSGHLSANNKIKANDFDMAVSGSGSIDIELEAKDVDASVSGSGTVKLAGNSDAMSCSISGSGNINGYEMTVNKVTARISGSGSAKLNVKDEIHATTSGSGNVRYTGNPDIIEAKSSGSGSVKKRS